ncbi:sigma-70 family RNA polymerase sigma factor [bacterium]|nr:sigma-70 family RNA polymerase sigma factor [bacterium]
MEITQEKIDLIAKIIKSDRKFANNEDLFDDFLNETCRRSTSIIGVIENDATLEAYLRKVVTTSILRVLKDSGRLRRTKTGYMTTTEVPLETVAPVAELTVAPTPAPSSLIDLSIVKIGYEDLDISIDPEENAIHNEIIDFVADTIERVNQEAPNERYMDIFILRYDKGLTQKEIAHELGISQSEVSKRIYSLIEKVKNVLNEQ